MKRLALYNVLSCSIHRLNRDQWGKLFPHVYKRIKYIIRYLEINDVLITQFRQIKGRIQLQIARLYHS